MPPTSYLLTLLVLSFDSCQDTAMLRELPIEHALLQILSFRRIFCLDLRVCSLYESSYLLFQCLNLRILVLDRRRYWSLVLHLQLVLERLVELLELVPDGLEQHDVVACHQFQLVVDRVLAVLQLRLEVSLE